MLLETSTSTSADGDVARTASLPVAPLPQVPLHQAPLVWLLGPELLRVAPGLVARAMLNSASKVGVDVVRRMELPVAANHRGKAVS